MPLSKGETSLAQLASRAEWDYSLDRLRAILDRLDRHDIGMYRMPTGLAPYASHPDMPQLDDQVRECAEELVRIGLLARERGIRLSSHPGQYTVLNSERPDVQAVAAAELEVQAAILDAMGLGPQDVALLRLRDQLAERGLASDAGHVRAPGA